MRLLAGAHATHLRHGAHGFAQTDEAANHADGLVPDTGRGKGLPVVLQRYLNLFVGWVTACNADKRVKRVTLGVACELVFFASATRFVMPCGRVPKPSVSSLRHPSHLRGELTGTGFSKRGTHRKL